MMRTDWIREQREVVRDALHGDLAVRARGQQYLPKLEGMTAEEYKRYQDRGKFYPIPRNTLTTMLGTALSKPPVVKLPDRLKRMERTCGIRGEPLVNIIEEALSEALSIGQIGLFLHHPGGVNVTPRIETFTAETIVDEPTIEWVDGVQKLTKVKVRDGSKQVEDGVRDVDMTLYLNPKDEGRCWVKRSYWESSLASEVVISDQRYDVGAYPVTDIPFLFCSFDGVAPRTVEPPMYAICRLAIQTWATSAEKNNTIYRAGFPQYWIAGPVTEDAIPKTTGPGNLWVFPQGTVVGKEQADAASAEITEKEIQSAIAQMLQMGASFMGAGNMGGTASSTNRDVASMKLRGQMALLHQTVNNIEEAFKRIFEWAIHWEFGTTTGKLTPQGQAALDELTFAMNREFVEAGVTPAMLKVLYDMTAMDMLSRRALYAVLDKSGMTLDGVDFDQDQADIEYSPWAIHRGNGQTAALAGE